MIRLRRPVWALLLLALAGGAVSPVRAGEVVPDVRPSTPALGEVGPVDPEILLCPNLLLDQSGRLVEHCSPAGTPAEYAVRVYRSPFDRSGAGDWLASRDLIEPLNIDDLVSSVGSGVASIAMRLELLLREYQSAEDQLITEFGVFDELEPRLGGLIYALVGGLFFVAVFGGLVGWLLLRRRRRRQRRINAARRTATALLGELVAIRDELRELELDNRPGRLDDLERVAARRQAFLQNQAYLRLIGREVAAQIIGFYGDLRQLPFPYVEERVGKLGTHRVLRLDAADSFARQSQALASRASQLADMLRAWLDQHLPRRAPAQAYRRR